MNSRPRFKLSKKDIGHQLAESFLRLCWPCHRFPPDIICSNITFSLHALKLVHLCDSFDMFNLKTDKQSGAPISTIVRCFCLNEKGVVLRYDTQDNSWFIGAILLFRILIPIYTSFSIRAILIHIYVALIGKFSALWHIIVNLSSISIVVFTEYPTHDQQAHVTYLRLQIAPLIR